MKISTDPVDFTRDQLVENDLAACPFQQFENWYGEAEEFGIEAPNAMSLATASKEGLPTIRTVLLKDYDKNGFVFFTNYGSQKAQQIEENPHASLLFPWITMGRQVIVKGSVARVSKKESLNYFLSRPRLSQLGAWASNQSKSVDTRALLDQAFQQIKTRFQEGKIPLPDFWGGYRVSVETIEFWQSRKNRLHDRLQYEKGKEDSWLVSRLNP